MANLLLEILCEEIPAGLQEWGASELERVIVSQFAKAGFPSTTSMSFSTPRRLTVVLGGLPAASPATTHERRGPRKGAPDKALLGFSRAVGIEPEQLEVRETGKGNYYFAVVVKPGVQLQEIASEQLCSSIESLTWPKSMRWGSGNFRWIRPIRSVLCFLEQDRDGSQVVDLEIAGIRSGLETSGHRFLAPKRFEVCSIQAYESSLRKAKVMLRADERRRYIREAAEEIARRHRLEVWPDEDLIKEIAGLVEWPHVLAGRIPDAFRSLPNMILRTAIGHHQKYLALRVPGEEKVTHFVTVANTVGTPEHKETILAGNTRVLCARLADASFFYEADLMAVNNCGLDGFRERLGGVNYHAVLGSQLQRTDRITRLARSISISLRADVEAATEAASYCKADLVSQVVVEFPELQGIIGGHYAYIIGREAEVCTAIEQHYLPSGDRSKLPGSVVACAVALADRINHLAGFYLAGERATGSKDPHALRRSALAIIRIILEQGFPLALRKLVVDAIANHFDQSLNGLRYSSETKEQAADDILAFVRGRFAVLLRQQGMDIQAIEACLGTMDLDDLVEARQRISCLQSVIDGGRGTTLVQPYIRAVSILRAAGFSVQALAGEVEPALFTHAQERQLYEALEILDGLVNRVNSNFAVVAFAEALDAVCNINSPLETFFSSIMVNVEDLTIRRNRLAMLAMLASSCSQLADFSILQPTA